MPDIGRNDPCPCGSGRKYKKCCLSKDEGRAQRVERASELEARTLHRALHCLGEPGDELLDQLIHDDLLAGPTIELGELWNILDSELLKLVDENLQEWALAEGVVSAADGSLQRGVDLVLESSAADTWLQPDERGWLQELRRRPVGLFRVGHEVSDRTIEMVDLLDSKQGPLRANHWRLNGFLEPDDVCLARPVMFEGEWYLTAAVFPFVVASYGASLAEAVQGEDTAERRLAGVSGDDAGFSLSRARALFLLHAWLREQVILEAPEGGSTAVCVECGQHGTVGPAQHAPRRHGSAGPKPRTRPQHDESVVNLRHFLDDEGRFTAALSKQGRRIGEDTADIVAVASGAFADRLVETHVRCRRRPGHVSCKGTIVASRVSVSDQIEWACPECGDAGYIRGWRGTMWDRSKGSAPSEVGGTAGEAEG